MKHDYFIRCISPRLMQDALYAIKDGLPHKLVHPQSIDRDWFATKTRAAAVKRGLQRKLTYVRLRVEKQ